METRLLVRGMKILSLVPFYAYELRSCCALGDLCGTGATTILGLWFAPTHGNLGCHKKEAERPSGRIMLKAECNLLRMQGWKPPLRSCCKSVFRCTRRRCSSIAFVGCLVGCNNKQLIVKQTRDRSRILLRTNTIDIRLNLWKETGNGNTRLKHREAKHNCTLRSILQVSASAERVDDMDKRLLIGQTCLHLQPEQSQ